MTHIKKKTVDNISRANATRSIIMNLLTYRTLKSGQ